MSVAADHETMRRALSLAELGWGSVHPNPLVGAVVVRDGEVVGEGWHERYGEAHAEVNALGQAGAGARGATLYITLEPCSHHGRTPPCTDAVLAAGIRRVVIAASDPNPVAGGGAERLRSAGLEVVTGVEEDAARRQNRAFLHRHMRRGPYVAVKLAVSLDACIAAAPGERTAITGEAALAAVQRLRAGFDAILIGSRTALTDDPLLTVRGAPVRVPPTRVVLDSALRLSPESRLAGTASEAPVLVLTSPGADPTRRAALEAGGVAVEEVAAGPAGVDLPGALGALQARGLHALLVEGGGVLAASFLADDRVSRLHLFQAPVLLGAGAVAAFPAGAKRRVWVPVKHERLGPDLHVILDSD